MTHAMTDNLSAHQDTPASFHVVDQLSRQLSRSYEELQEQVTRLTAELTESRSRFIQELHEKERLANRFYHVLQSLPAAVIVVDEKDRVDEFNTVAEIIFPEIRWGRRWHEIFQDSVASQTASNEWRLKDGTCVSVSTKTLEPDPGKIMVVVDVSDSRELQEQLNRQQRLAEMGEMAAHLAHQIRTPVASALLYSEHLGRHDLRRDQREKFSQRLRQSLRHTENQVRDLLSFARGSHYEPATVNLSNLIGDVEDQVESFLKAGNAKLEIIDQSNGCAFIKGNSDALGGAIVNLIENALRHGGDHVHIRMMLRPVEDGFCIRIDDNGDGVPADIRKEIFNPFFTTSSDGTGLGLAVVQNVILSHGGAIELSSSPTDSRYKGAGFIICLPAMETASEQQTAGDLS
jgi:two-component system sensor histidine kinase FlrB